MCRRCAEVVAGRARSDDLVTLLRAAVSPTIHRRRSSIAYGAISLVAILRDARLRRALRMSAECAAAGLACADAR